MSQAKLNRTVGTASATIENPQISPSPYAFQADTDVMMWQHNGKTEIQLSERIVSGVSELVHYLHISFVDVKPDGVANHFDLSDSSTVVMSYVQIYFGVVKAYTANVGSITVTLDAQERMLIQIDAGVSWNNEKVFIKNGQADLTGFIRPGASKSQASGNKGTGSMNGTMVGGPSPGPFVADAVRINRVPDNPITGQKGYSAVIGEWHDGFPPTRKVLFFLLPLEKSGYSFDFAIDKDVKGSFARLIDSYSGEAIAGGLNFSSRPENANAVGSADCTLRGNHPEPYNLTVAFDVTEPLHK